VPAVITPLPPLPAMATDTEVAVPAPAARPCRVSWSRDCTLCSFDSVAQVKPQFALCDLIQIKFFSFVCVDNGFNKHCGTTMQQ
jgi:hypothetical protein